MSPTSTANPMMPTSSPCDLCPSHDPPTAPPSPVVTLVATPVGSPVPTPPATPPETPPSSLSPPAGHPMLTRGKAGIFKPRHIVDLSYVGTSDLHQALFSSKEPKGFKSQSKDPKWYAAMRDEMKALHLNSTWELIPRPSHANIVGSKWVFRTKFMLMVPLINTKRVL